MRVVAQLIEDLPHASSVGEVIDGVMNLPFMKGITGIMMTRVPILGEKLSENVIFSTWSDAWINHYTDNNYLKIDPITRHLFSTRRPFVWSEYCSIITLNDAETNIMREARNHGLIDGVTIPVHDFSSTICISFSTDGFCLSTVHRELLRTVGLIALERIDDIISFQKHMGAHAHSVLAPREIDCLYYARMGANSKEIARMLGISFRTVDKYILTATRKLSARNRAEAILIALERGLFHS